MVIQVAPISSKPNTVDHVAPEPVCPTNPEAPEPVFPTAAEAPEPVSPTDLEAPNPVWAGTYQVGRGFLGQALDPFIQCP